MNTGENQREYTDKESLESGAGSCNEADKNSYGDNSHDGSSNETKKGGVKL